MRKKSRQACIIISLASWWIVSVWVKCSDIYVIAFLFPFARRQIGIFEEIFKIMWLNLQHLSTTLPTVQFGIIDRLVECNMKYVCVLLMYMVELKKNSICWKKYFRHIPIEVEEEENFREGIWKGLRTEMEFYWNYLLKILLNFHCTFFDSIFLWFY